MAVTSFNIAALNATESSMCGFCAEAVEGNW
jgi:hypothetical protein